MPEISCGALHLGKFPSLRKKRPEEEKERNREGEREKKKKRIRRGRWRKPAYLKSVWWPRTSLVRGHFVASRVRFVVLIIPNVRPRATSSRNQKFRAPAPRYRSKFPNPIRLFILAVSHVPFSSISPRRVDIFHVSAPLDAIWESVGEIVFLFQRV